MDNKNYTTEIKVKNYLGESVDNESYVKEAILAVQKLVDKYTGRNFRADESASYRYYSGNGEQDLRIDDCIEVTEVKRGLDEYKDSDEEISAGGFDGYYLYPFNNCYTTDDQENPPINMIRLRNRVWIRGFGNHLVKAKWGYSEEVPDDISFACTIIAGGLYNWNVSSNIKSESIGNYSVGYSSDTGWSDFKKAKRVLDNYKKWNL